MIVAIMLSTLLRGLVGLRLHLPQGILVRIRELTGAHSDINHAFSLRSLCLAPVILVALLLLLIHHHMPRLLLGNSWNFGIAFLL